MGALVRADAQASLRQVGLAWLQVSQQLSAVSSVSVEGLQLAGEVRRAVAQTQLPADQLRSIEAKVSALEGSVLGAGARGFRV
jgi:hypothetical protein